MRYQIAMITLLGILSGCSDSDSPASGSQDSSSATADSATTAPAADPAPAGPKPQTQPEQPPNLVRYECNDGTLFEAELMDQGIAMVINDISYDLRQQPSSSGTLYADDSTSFQINGEQALLTNEQGTRECQKVAPPKVGQGDIPEPIQLEADPQANQGD